MLYREMKKLLDMTTLGLFDLTNAGQPGIHTGLNGGLPDCLSRYMQQLLQFSEVFDAILVQLLFQQTPHAAIQNVEIWTVGWPAVEGNEAREALLKVILHQASPSGMAPCLGSKVSWLHPFRRGDFLTLESGIHRDK